MYFHEARMMGAQVEAPCVNHSAYLSSLHGEDCIYMGFNLVKDLERSVVKTLLLERKRAGFFQD